MGKITANDHIERIFMFKKFLTQRRFSHTFIRRREAFSKKLIFSGFMFSVKITGKVGEK